MIFSFLALSFQESIIVGVYQINKEYITKNFCVNKSKPKMKCNGKCHLKKVLKKAKNQEKKSFPVGTLNLKTIAYVKPEFDSKILTYEKVKINQSTTYNERLNSIILSYKIFHPPQV